MQRVFLLLAIKPLNPLIPLNIMKVYISPHVSTPPKRDLTMKKSYLYNPPPSTPYS